MEKIQIAIADSPYRQALARTLSQSVPCEVICVDDPDTLAAGVLVLDTDHLDSLPHPISRPERVVLVSHDNPEALSRAWDAGVNSVVYDRDPINTAVLAILAARLRSVKGFSRKGESK